MCYDQNCINCLSEIIGGRWRVIIISTLADGAKRFVDLQKAIPDISTRMLALDLRNLEETGVIVRTISMKAPIKVEYSLSPIGSDLKPIINALFQWGHKLAEQKYHANLSANQPPEAHEQS